MDGMLNAGDMNFSSMDETPGKSGEDVFSDLEDPPSMETNAPDLDDDDLEEPLPPPALLSEDEEDKNDDSVFRTCSLMVDGHHHDPPHPLPEVLVEEDDNVPCPSKSSPGVVGLRNVGNTCYMNSGLQCLLASPPVKFYFSERYGKDALKDPLPNSSQELCSRFASLLSDVWGGGFKILRPSEFKETLSNSYSQFRGSHQHDCQEFLALLLDSLHEELKNKSRPGGSVDGTSMELNAHLSTTDDTRDSMIKKKLETGDTDSASSPKSYDSFSSSSSSSNDRPQLTSIRNAPIPPGIKEEPFVVKSNNFSLNGTKKPFPFPKNSNNQSTAVSNSTLSFLINLEDYVSKENKTSNVNVVAEEPAGMNNEINFDSEKYSKEKSQRALEGVIKNTKSDNAPLVGRTDKTNNVAKEEEIFKQRQQRMKRIRLSSSPEKNIQTELERNFLSPSQDLIFDEEDDLPEDDLASIDDSFQLVYHTGASSASDDPLKLKETIEADRFWEKYLSVNDTVIARSFQGQFKNTVVCSVCSKVSVSFEPFMYLSVPLPNASIRQLDFYFLGKGSPLQIRLNLAQIDTIGTLKEKVKSILNLSEEDSKIKVMETRDGYSIRAVDDWVSLKSIKLDNSLVGYIPLVIPEEKMDDSSGKNSDLEKIMMTGATQSCVICMEDISTEALKQHVTCPCVLCSLCLERTIEHFKKEDPTAINIKCPGCRQEAEPNTEFLIPSKIGQVQPKTRILSLPVIYRIDGTSTPQVSCFGLPFTVTTPNVIAPKNLYSYLDARIQSLNYQIVLVSSQGKKCSRCPYHENCVGCVRLKRDDPSYIILMSQDTLGITYKAEEKELAEVTPINHESITNIPKLPSRLNLTDCLAAFSEKETLDEANPWFCSGCQKNQCATKTLTIWRFPDYLIIYLKRFVFLPGSIGAVKLETPVDFTLSNLDLTPYLSGPLPDGRPQFDLYGLVNHFGSVSGGHYTAYTKNETSWNYFDDSSVTEKKIPGMDDASSAYILFFKQEGLDSRSQEGRLSSRILSDKFNLDSLNLPSKRNGVEKMILNK